MKRFVGGGALCILDHYTEEGTLKCENTFYWAEDGLFDLTWSEQHEDIIWTGSGDGCIQVWDTKQAMKPIHVVKAHPKEISNIEWNQIRTDHPSVLSASWDFSVRMWDAVRMQTVQIFPDHNGIVYSSVWSPYIPLTFASTSGDGMLRIFNVKEPSSQPALMARASRTELLSCDWCKYNENILATGSVDGVIQVWDIRKISTGPITSFRAHNRAVKRIKFSPHQPSLLGSVSYDFMTKFWDYSKLLINPGYLPLAGPINPLLMTFQNHKEFVYGLDFNLHIEGQVVDCGWDRLIQLYSMNSRSYFR